MESPKKKSKIAKIIKDNQNGKIKDFDFFSFDEKKLLERRINELEQELAKKNQVLIELKHNFEKREAQMDIEHHENLEKMKNLSYDQGVADGQRKGFQEGENSVLKANEYLKNCAQTVMSEKNEILLKQEESVLLLVKKICEKILNSKLEDADDLILNIIKKSFSLITDRTSLKVRLSGSDLKVVEKNLKTIEALYVDIKNIDLVVDERVSKGGVIVETAGGSIDARFETQLETIYQTLKGKVREE